MTASQLQLDFSHAPAPRDAALLPFHPCVRAWFEETLGESSEPQKRAWPLISAGDNVLIAAPTGSGKTLAAFLSCLDRLFRRAVDHSLEERTFVVYVSPLKALANDVQKNLLLPLQQIYARAEAMGCKPDALRVDVRSGDTTAAERARMAKRPPHILITTPESLYLCLTAAKSRERLRHVDTVIVDEVHALVRDKRGSHFALSLERLKALLPRPAQMIGLSATQKPLSRIAAFLTGAPECEALTRCRTVAVGHIRPWELRIETPDAELQAVASQEMWAGFYARIAALLATHRTILVFTNTRRWSERLARDLGERVGAEKVRAHHGSMARELRLDAEEKLKSGALRVMVATASLELGIDVGAIDLVVQVGSPRAIAVMLQRLGRSGHHKAAISKGILYALTRDDLCECAALLAAIKRGELDAPLMPIAPLDVLAQQVVAMVACEDLQEEQVFSRVRNAWPYHGLARETFARVLHMLSEGVATARGRGRALIHRDRVHGMLRARKGARLVALQNGGAIPDTFTYPVIVEPEGKTIGALDEDFAIDSSPGDVFVLGSSSWRITRVIAGTVRVVDASGEAPSVPFWLGEAPARTLELSAAVSALREEVVARGPAYLAEEVGLSESDADALGDYIRVSYKMLGAIPSQKTVVAERFFDEAGGMQLIIHAPFGGRINRAWGMALRKRFCRGFDFELQAAAGDDGILLSLGEQHSFPLADIFDFLSPNNVEELLTQAILQAPLFGTRFRWNATRALMLDRMRNGERMPPQLQRMRSDDLLAAVFPAQVGCQDNHGGRDIEVPEHPLVGETLDNCLREALDVDGLREVLRQLKEGAITRHAVDLPEPSLMAHQHLNSAPYTFLDDAPLEERRARAVSMRRSMRPEDAVAFGALDELAIRQVKSDAQALVRNPEELHDALLLAGLMRAELVDDALLAPLVAAQRALRFAVAGALFVVARERIPVARALFLSPALGLEALPGDAELSREEATLMVVRGRLESCGPTTARELALKLHLPASDVLSALFHIEAQGLALRGTFWPKPRSSGELPAAEIEFCDRRLLQRIHRLTVGKLRKEIEPLSSSDYMRFLLRWHGVDGSPQALDPALCLQRAIEKLEGFHAPASQWESGLFAARVKDYDSELLDRACYQGEVAWARANLGPPEEQQESARVSRHASITFVRRAELDWVLAAAHGDWAHFRDQSFGHKADAQQILPLDLSASARIIAATLSRRGACFFVELVQASKQTPEVVEDALWELLARGVVSADAVENLRVLQSPKRRKQLKLRVRQRGGAGGQGRWWLLQSHDSYTRDDLIERLAMMFLRRYGIVWRDLVVREALCPSWRELVHCYRRLEARGDIRGGRFIGAQVGEQYALPDAVDQARAIRRETPSVAPVRIAATDPLNLTGIVTAGSRIAALPQNVVVYSAGIPRAELN